MVVGDAQQVSMATLVAENRLLNALTKYIHHVPYVSEKVLQY